MYCIKCTRSLFQSIQGLSKRISAAGDHAVLIDSNEHLTY